MKKVTSSLNIIVVLLLAASLLSCSSEEQEPLPYHYDILSKLFAHPSEATKEILFGNAPEFAHYLVQGWSKGEETLRWTNSSTAKLAFYHNGPPTATDLKIRWKSLQSQQKNTQKANILLNGKKIKSLNLKSSFTSQKVRLPASSVFPGFNLLTFQFSHTEAHDKREPAAAFEKIQIRNDSSVQVPFVHSLDRADILQQANSGVGMFLALPESFDLEVEYQALRGTKAYIEVLDERGTRQKLPLPSGKTRVTRRFSFPKSGLYRIHAVTTGKQDEAVIWKQVQIRTNTAQVHLEEPAQIFVTRTHEQEKTEDILLYVIDTLRADHVGCYGYTRRTTPNIDAFAADNALYSNAYASSSWTKPSGASILTGLLPHRHQANSRDAKLPDELVTLAEILQERDYYSAAFITNGSLADYFGFAQGFDTFIYFPEDNATRAVHTRASEVNAELFSFLREYREREVQKPLFLLFWSSDPHNPYTPPEDVLELFDIQQYEPVDTNLKLLANIRHGGLELTASQLEFVKARYDQDIFANDRAFGELLDELKALGLYQDMTIVLSADHGDEFFEHGGVGHALTLYNEQIRVPFVVKSPDIAPGTYQHAVQITDIYPTILDALGIDEPYPLDGISLLRPADTQRVIYTEVTFAGNDVVARQDKEKKL
ncbi:MAG: sulfatase, partial [bacterium]|nr:sulfatase [bacterium]